MNISSSDLREPFFVPSIKCQSLLGKAIQEHFTKTDQIASVFSSSPSLQNSSAGANFLTNFKLDWQTVKLCEAIFTPEDCFSIQFAPCIEVFAEGFVCERIFNMISNLINKTRFLEASLRSLAISSDLITDEQLQFILSNLKRITKLEFEFGEDCKISSNGISGIAEHLPELAFVRISSKTGVTAPVLALFASKLLNLKTLNLADCLHLDDDCLLEISKIQSLTSFACPNCRAVTSVGFNYLASMVSLKEINVQWTRFSSGNLQLMCPNLLLLERLNLTECHVSSGGIKHLKSLPNLNV
jgi:hypothetical protein